MKPAVEKPAFRRVLIIAAVVVTAAALAVLVWLSARSDERKLPGTYYSAFDFGPSFLIEDADGPAGSSWAEDMDLTMECLLVLTLEKDNTWSLGLDIGDVLNSGIDFLERMTDYLIGYTYSEMEKEGMDRSEADEFYRQEYGTSVQEYIKERIEDEFGLSEMKLARLPLRLFSFLPGSRNVQELYSGVYSASDGEIYFNHYEESGSEHSLPDTYEAGLLNVTISMDGTGGMFSQGDRDAFLEMGYSFPLIFTKNKKPSTSFFK